MNKSIRILNTPVRFYPYMGGVEHSSFYLSKSLLKLGINMNVICARASNREATFIDGINIRRLNSFFKVTNTDITLSLPFWLIKEKYDILHTHMPTPWSSDWSILIAKIMGKKSIITIHNDMDKPGFFPKLITNIYLNTFFKFSLSLVDKIIVINPEWKTVFTNTAKILDKYQDKLVVIPNGVDLSIFYPKKIKKQKKTILFVSILDKYHLFKGVDYLLEAMVIIKKNDPQIKLTVVGEGELKNLYIKKAKEFGISRQIEFVGKMDQKQLVDYYNMATLFILPSIDIEGFGNVLTEAMACKTPVITTTKVGMFKDIKKTNCGLIIPPKDPSAISDAILKIIKNPVLAKEMGNNGRKLVENKYRWEQIASQTKLIYQNVLGN